MDEEVPSRFVCSICCEVLKTPTLIDQCGHRFCEECLRQMLPSADGSFCCPICRLPFLLEGGCRRDMRLEDEIAGTIITCNGCQQQLSLLYFNSHSVSCSKRKNTLPHMASTSQPRPLPGPNRSTFTCPFCAQQNFDCSGLLAHVNRHHANSREPVVCPVCASMPWGNPSQKSQDFVSHMNLRHKFEYDVFVDYEQDDDTALKAALENSCYEK